MSKVRKIRCEACGERVPSHEVISCGDAVGGYRDLCGQCFNAEVARLTGHDTFEDFRIEPVRLVDCAGETHEFHFRTRLLGHIVTIDAFELLNGSPSGYQCEIAGDPEDDLLGLLGRLVDKLRRMLSVKHITWENHDPQIAEQTVRGRIQWDDSAAGHTPLLTIDGREVSWEQFSRMLMTFEGWQFRLQIFDPTDEP
ncbi:MAG: hypothetical protein KDH15_12570 [Rhodocyclaceae bacterium]|nr:hypothetical protein [Rhodocyclaceae bacterium]